jgi:hypothetical protein
MMSTTNTFMKGHFISERNILDHEDNLIAINPKWDKLITALRGAVSQDYKLLKNESPYSDLTDAFRLAMKYFTLERS